MDIQTPIMDGIQATLEIMKDKEIRIKPAIIALTANAMKGDRETYCTIGIS